MTTNSKVIRRRNLNKTLKVIKELKNAGLNASVRISNDTGNIQKIYNDNIKKNEGMRIICDFCNKKKEADDCFLDSNNKYACRDCIEKQCPALKDLGGEWNII